MEPSADIGHHAELCQELDSSAWERGEPFRCVCGQSLRDQEALMSEEDKQRLVRLRAVTREFFADKPVGTAIEQHDLDAYRQRLQNAARGKDTA